MKMKKKRFWIAIGFLVAFVVWTVLVRFVDVCAIGPRGSEVGFATLNGAFHKLTGTNMLLYTITDWLGLVPIFVAFGFAIFGLWQWIKRRSFFKVDRSLLVLGGCYLLVMAVYIFFEFVVINRRPVLIEGVLEASYPSSTTMLVMCVIPTAMLQWNARIKNKVFRRCIFSAGALFTVFMVLGRLISGVHWLTDILGGALFSAGVVLLYHWGAFNRESF